MTKLNKALMATTAIAFASGLALPAVAQDPSAAPGVVKSSNKMKLRLYGQVTRGFGVINDGETSTFKQFRNGNTSTRMGIDGRGKVTKDVSLRTRVEYEIRNGSANQFDGQGKDDAGLVIRHLDAIFSHKRLGAVWIGRGDTAANGTSEKNLLPGGSAGRLGGSTHNLITDASVLLDTSGTVESSELATLSRFFNSFDGSSRRQRIRYDTPTIAGFKIGASAIDQQSWDVAMHYKGKVAGVKIAAGAGFTHLAGNLGENKPLSQDTNQLNGSISVLTPFGLGATFSGGKQWLDYESGVPDALKAAPYNINPAIFYTGKWTELGPTGIEYAYQFSNEIGAVPGIEGQGHSVQITQVLANTGTDTFVGFRYFDIDTGVPGLNAENLWFFGAGFRARF
ncbi:MAG: porin [Alphaproteobacteria bacterium]|nr:porin [Alphaproteobacteria bacterium]